ncbi:DinB family protein [Hymenobacter terricola]|uniref:DinB family protein n=1 Tax=Hymenobacter terricola TaxID=2819236 RepID=UPI001B306951|nr:DinB family protein [Hymenobacter terricola]
MLSQDLCTLFQRDLQRLAQQIAAFPDEASLWQVAAGISNSAGNLCLHLVGNLNTYIGAVLGHSGYVRNRNAEFTTQHVPQAVLVQQVKDTTNVVERTLTALTEAQLQTAYPDEVLGDPMTTQAFLIHLYGHLTYHLGQIDYHRRLLTQGQALQFVN